MIRRWVRTLICLFRTDCEVFTGDAFTRWLDGQRADSAKATMKHHARRQKLEPTGNYLADRLRGIEGDRHV